MTDLRDITEWRLGEGGSAVGGDVEGRFGTGIEDGTILLVTGNDAARGEGYVHKFTLVAANLDTSAER
ncbi:hypothetical protein Ct61P_00165 [Colletotrichum tofieldiae]|nr:hypothetical protein Ct61P_00165 [Colletotrichum tofieldiae]